MEPAQFVHYRSPGFEFSVNARESPKSCSVWWMVLVGLGFPEGVQKSPPSAGLEALGS